MKQNVQTFLIDEHADDRASHKQTTVNLLTCITWHELLVSIFTSASEFLQKKNSS